MFPVTTDHIPLHSKSYILCLFGLQMSGSSPGGLVRLRPSRPLHQDPPQRSDNANTYSKAFRQIKKLQAAEYLRICNYYF